MMSSYDLLFFSGSLPLFAGPTYGMTFIICAYLYALASGLLLRFFGNNFSPSFSLPLFFVNRIVTTSFWSPSFSARRVPPSSLLSSLFSATVIVVSLVGVSTIPTARCDLFLCPPILLTYLFFFVSYFSLFKVLYANPYYASYSSSRRLIRNKLIYFVQNIVAILLRDSCNNSVPIYFSMPRFVRNSESLLLFYYSVFCLHTCLVWYYSCSI